MKQNVYLAQVNNRFGDSLFLPYSVGLLQAYAEQFPEVLARYEFKGFIVERIPPKEVIKQIDNPEILGLSCYIWNFQYNIALAKEVREAFPGCLIVAGGPHIPEKVPEDFFQRHTYFDILVHHEGEETFKKILLEKDITKIPGTTNQFFGTIPGFERAKEIDRFPSPYLTGVFDKLMHYPRPKPTIWDMSQETNRGCPYQCHFCDWGSAVFQKVRKFTENRIELEYRWAADNKIGLIYNCDANYGLFERDQELTDKLVATKAEFGYPKQFRAAYAKNSNQRVFDIAKRLNDSGMCKGVTLSFQSLNEPTLSLIKRKNMKMNDFNGLIKKYTEAEIPTYTEMILGLPGETYDSFVDGIDTLLDAGQHDSINIYPCALLPNAEMSDPKYREAHGIQSVTIPDIATHSIPAEDPYPEQKEVVIGTATMPTNDWRTAYAFGAIVQGLHSMGLTQRIARTLREQQNIKYKDFYKALLFNHECIPLLSTANTIAMDASFRVLNGGPWDLVLKHFGPVSWTPEEAIFLTIVRQYKAFLDNLQKSMLFSISDELLQAQYDSVVTPNDYLLDLERYAKEIVWYGRKASRWKRVRQDRADSRPEHL